MRLIEFTPELPHPEQCTTGHNGYILKVTLELKFDHEVLVYTEGDGVLIPDGDQHKHILRAITASVLLLSIEEL